MAWGGEVGGSVVSAFLTMGGDTGFRGAAAGGFDVVLAVATEGSASGCVPGFGG